MCFTYNITPEFPKKKLTDKLLKNAIEGDPIQ